MTNKRSYKIREILRRKIIVRKILSELNKFRLGFKTIVFKLKVKYFIYFIIVLIENFQEAKKEGLLGGNVQEY